MSQPTNQKPRAEGMSATVGLATQMANCLLVALRETYHYLVPKAQAEGIEIDAQSAHALAVSLWIQLARERAWLRMPATRFERKAEQPQKAEPPSEKPVPFAEPNISPALRKLREMLANDRVNEEELLAIFTRIITSPNVVPQQSGRDPDSNCRVVPAKMDNHPGISCIYAR
jgi:hypothetical protein